MRSYTVKENPIGLAVSKILRYRQTNTHPVTLLRGEIPLLRPVVHFIYQFHVTLKAHIKIAIKHNLIAKVMYPYYLRVAVFNKSIMSVCNLKSLKQQDQLK